MEIKEDAEILFLDDFNMSSIDRPSPRLSMILSD